MCRYAMMEPRGADAPPDTPYVDMLSPVPHPLLLPNPRMKINCPPLPQTPKHLIAAYYIRPTFTSIKKSDNSF